MGVGVGEWRPEKKGDFGTYRVDVSRNVEVLPPLAAPAPKRTARKR